MRERRFFLGVASLSGYCQPARIVSSGPAEHVFSVTIPKQRSVRLFVDPELAVTDASGNPVETRRPTAPELSPAGRDQLTVDLTVKEEVCLPARSYGNCSVLTEVSALVGRVVRSVVCGAAPPVINPRGVVNAASFGSDPEQGMALVGGGIVSIFGQNLAVSAQAATQIPLPTKLAGTSVTVARSAQRRRPCRDYGNAQKRAGGNLLGPGPDPGRNAGLEF